MDNEDPSPGSLDEIARHLNTFLDAARAVDDISSFIANNSRELDSVEGCFVREAQRLYPGISTQRHQAAANFVHPKIHEGMKLRKKWRTDGISDEEFNRLDEEWYAGFKAEFDAINNDPRDYYRYTVVWRRASANSGRSRILRKSLLVSMVSDFEVLVANLINEFLRANPGALNSSDQKYTYADIQAYESIDEFRENVRERAAERVLYGSFQDWMRWFSKSAGLTIPGVTDEPSTAIEIFQRRHLFVHNGGVVNTQYIAKTKASEAPAVGKQLLVTPEYLTHAVSVLGAIAIKLSMSLAVKLQKDQAEYVSKIIGVLTYELLLNGDYVATMSVAEWHQSIAYSDGDRLTAQVNYLTALRYKDPDAAAAQAEDWDTSALADRFKLARLALLARYEDAYSLVDRLIQIDELKADDWLNWPVLSGVRKWEADHIELEDRIEARLKLGAAASSYSEDASHENASSEPLASKHSAGGPVPPPVEDNAPQQSPSASHTEP